MDDPDKVGERLERLREATSRIEPGAGLAARIVSALAARPRPPSWAEAVDLTFRKAVLVGVLAAAAGIALALHADSDLAGALVTADTIGDLAP